MTVKQYAVRLKADGGAEFVREAKGAETALKGVGTAAVGAGEASEAAADRVTRKWQMAAGAARDAAQAQNAQKTWNAMLGFGTNDTRSARDSAEVFAAQAEEMDRLDRSARHLKTVIDPLGAAQDRLNDEMREYQALAQAGRISSQELATAQTMARARFDDTSAALERQSRGITRLAAASRLNLARQGADVLTTAAMGMNPAMIAIQQGPQIADAWATSNLKLSASFIGVVGAVGLVVGAAAVLSAAWMEGERSALSYERAATGIGRTAQVTAAELKAAAEAGAEAGEISIRSAQAQAAAYLATGKIGGEVISGLIALNKDYASFISTDVEGATKSLAKAMEDPAKAAREMTREFGLFDQVTLDNIDTLVKHGERLAAQKILLDGLAGAVDGHSDKVSGITSAWGWATKAMSNYWTKLGEALYTTREEQLAKYEAAIANARRSNANPAAIDRMETARTALEFDIGYDRAKAENDARSAAANQAAQEAKDRHDAGKSARDKAAREAERLAREAERDAREALARARREEDVAAARAQQIAQATNDFSKVKDLEAEARVRTRIRQLVDDDVEAGKARATALSEEAELRAALEQQVEREAKAMSDAASLEADRIEGLNRYVQFAETRVELEDRILKYRQKGYDLVTATSMAEKDQLNVTEARERVLKRLTLEAEAEHKLRLAGLRGDDDEARRLDIEARTQRRAREIEQRLKLNHGDGEKQARTEIREELDAEAVGVRRVWMRDFIADIRRGGIKDALGQQFESAADRLANRLIDQLFALDWSSLLSGGKGGGGGSGVGKMLVDAASWFFKKPGANAAGTDFWEGGLTWVGERGPELLELPRGSKVMEHNRSMQALQTAQRQSMSGANSSFTFAPVIHAEGAGPREVEVLRGEIQAMEGRLRREFPSMMRDATSRRQV